MFSCTLQPAGIGFATGETGLDSAVFPRDKNGRKYVRSSIASCHLLVPALIRMAKA